MGKLLSFNDRVSLAIKAVQAQYPEAKLLEVGGVSTIGSTTNPNHIDQLQVWCQNTDGSAVIVNEQSTGRFKRPVLLSGYMKGDQSIHWPITMDLATANRLKENAGYLTPYRKVTLRTPMAPIRFNPYFVFGHDVESYVFVDAVTGIVHSGH